MPRRAHKRTESGAGVHHVIRTFLPAEMKEAERIQPRSLVDQEAALTVSMACSDNEDAFGKRIGCLDHFRGRHPLLAIASILPRCIRRVSCAVEGFHSFIIARMPPFREGKPCRARPNHK